MTLDSPAVRSLVATLLLLVLAGCGPKPPPPKPPKSPPQVFLTFPEGNVVGTEIAVSVSVVGCTTVKDLGIWHTTPEGAEQIVLNAPYSSSPTAVVIPANKIPYPLTGVAAQLNLKAKAVCEDDRLGSSSSVSAVFFPVEKVISKDGALVVPQSFVASGQGANTLFFGCSGGASAGSTQLARVNVSGDVTATKSPLPYPCTTATVITPSNLASGKRWAWEKDVGGYAFDVNLQISAQTSGPTTALGVMPNGDAIVWDKSALNGSLKWIQHASGQVKWPADPLGRLAGAPTYRQSFGVYVPELNYEQATLEDTLRIEVLNEASGSSVQTYDITKWKYGLGDEPLNIHVAFNNDASLIYFPVPLPGLASSQVWACSSTGVGCSGNNRLWTTVDLPGVATVIVPFHNGSKLAAVGADFTWFIDAATGGIINSADGATGFAKGIEPSGQLITYGVEVNSKGTDVYLLNGPHPNSGRPRQAIEIVGIESPQQGEVFRYEVAVGSSVSVAVDDSGGPPGSGTWLRIGNNLVKPKLMSDYRVARGGN